MTSLAEQVQLQRAEQQADSARTRLDMRAPVPGWRGPRGRGIKRTTKVERHPWPCPGCGELRSAKRRRFCEPCRLRVRDGIPLDVEQIPTAKECEDLARRLEWLPP